MFFEAPFLSWLRGLPPTPWPLRWHTAHPAKMKECLEGRVKRPGLCVVPILTFGRSSLDWGSEILAHSLMADLFCDHQKGIHPTRMKEYIEQHSSTLSGPGLPRQLPAFPSILQGRRLRKSDGHVDQQSLCASLVRGDVQIFFRILLICLWRVQTKIYIYIYIDMLKPFSFLSTIWHYATDTALIPTFLGAIYTVFLRNPFHVAKHEVVLGKSMASRQLSLSTHLFPTHGPLWWHTTQRNVCASCVYI